MYLSRIDLTTLAGTLDSVQRVECYCCVQSLCLVPNH